MVPSPASDDITRFILPGIRNLQTLPPPPPVPLLLDPLQKDETLGIVPYILESLTPSGVPKIAAVNWVAVTK